MLYTEQTWITCYTISHKYSPQVFYPYRWVLPKTSFFIVAGPCHHCAWLSSQICYNLWLACHFSGSPAKLCFLAVIKTFCHCHSYCYCWNHQSHLPFVVQQGIGLHYHMSQNFSLQSFILSWVQNLKIDVVVAKIIVGSATSKIVSIIIKSIAIPTATISTTTNGYYQSHHQWLLPKPPRPPKFTPQLELSSSPQQPPWLPPKFPEVLLPLWLDEAVAVSYLDRAFLLHSCRHPQYGISEWQSYLQSHGHQRLQKQSLSFCCCLSDSWFQSLQFSHTVQINLLGDVIQCLL